MIFPKTERQVSFCEHYIRTGNALQSAKAAGYGTSDESAKRRGTELSKRYKEYIDSEIRQNLGSLVPIALKIVAELAEHGESETVRLKAAQDIMDRAGYKPTAKVEQKMVSVEERSTEELEEELKQLGYH